MNVLLTGGCGFIGSNILKKLINYDNLNQIHVIDNLSTGNLLNIKKYVDGVKVFFHNIDIRDTTACTSLMRNIDVIIHQAALGSVPRSIHNPLDTNDNNINGFLSLMSIASKIGIKRFIFAGSSSSYGDSTALPKIESITGNLLSPYAVTKYVNELYAEVFHRCYGLNYIGLRYFNVFGPNQDSNSSYSAVIPRFCRNILQCEDIVINGNGSISRDFTYVDNVVEANILALFSDNDDSLNRIYNVACGEMYSIKYLAEQLINISGSKVKIIFGPDRLGDINYSLASIDKIKNYLGYEPKIKFEDGLIKTWEFYKNNFSKK